MKQKLIILITLLSIGIYANAQEYRLAKSSGTLKLNITGIIVEGYDGKDIVFSGEKVVVEESSDERAKGLVAISSSKLVDNTGLGISVTENGQDVNVNLATKKTISVLTVKVPNNMKVSIANNTYNNGLFLSYSTSTGTSATKTGGDIVLKNLKSEIEVSVYGNKIRLENNTGPMNIKTVSGPIEAVFSGEIKGPVSIISATNYVDVTMPSSTKANIEMSSNYGKLYAGKEFKIDLDKESNEKFHYNISTNENGTRAINRLSGTLVDQDELITTTTSGSKIVKGTRVKSTNDEIVVKGYPTGTIAIAKGKDTVNVQAVRAKGIQIASSDLPSTSIYTFDSFSMRGGDRIKGKLNGGGIDLIFKSTNKNVYLRQQ